jgi:peroxiredoxin Q/BCP
MKRLNLALPVLLLAGLASAADLPAAGEKAPAFSLQSQDDTTISLEKLKGRWVVLYFYPKDFTSGCTVEAHNFQRDLEKYQKANAVIVGVSLDSVTSHKDFCAKEGLNFKLLSDADHSMTKAYGSLAKSGETEYAARNTFLIDPAGVVRKVYVKVNPSAHSDDVLKDLAGLQAAK